MLKFQLRVFTTKTTKHMTTLKAHIVTVCARHAATLAERNRVAKYMRVRTSEAFDNLTPPEQGMAAEIERLLKHRYTIIINENDEGMAVGQKVYSATAETPKDALAQHVNVSDDPNTVFEFEDLGKGVVRFANEETDGFIVEIG